MAKQDSKLSKLIEDRMKVFERLEERFALGAEKSSKKVGSTDRTAKQSVAVRDRIAWLESAKDNEIARHSAALGRLEIKIEKEEQVLAEIEKAAADEPKTKRTRKATTRKKAATRKRSRKR